MQISSCHNADAQECMACRSTIAAAHCRSSVSSIATVSGEDISCGIGVVARER